MAYSLSLPVGDRVRDVVEAEHSRLRSRKGGEAAGNQNLGEHYVTYEEDVERAWRQ